MEQIVFFALITFVLVAMVAVVAGWAVPLLQSARDVDPSWQMIDISGVVNFRERLYPVKIAGVVSSNCTSERVAVDLWYFFPQPPGPLQDVSLEEGLVKGVFNYTYGYAVGSLIATSKLYALKVATATFTNFTNVIPEQPIYGNPARVVYKAAKRLVITPQCPKCVGCTLTLKAGGKEVATIDANYIEIYIREAELK